MSFWKRRRKSQPRRQPNQSLILEPIWTPSGVVPDAGDDGIPDVSAVDSGFAFEDFEFTAGYFTVGDSGEVSIDYLFDGGMYEGEVGIFSLDGLDAEPGSEEFIKEAARRALSSSELGHVVIVDATEGALFSGNMTGEGDFNQGEHQGAKTVQMRAGDRFGFILTPNHSLEDVYSGQETEALFSLATANPNDDLQFGQIADITGDGNTFAMEDLSLSSGSDRDYNDVVFQVQGAEAEAPLMDDLVAEWVDWRDSDVGQDLIDYAGDAIAQTAKETRASQPFVGIIDTGFAADNPDLDYGRIQLGSDFVDGDGDPLLADDTGNEHGTHIAGIIGATQGNDLGIDGVNDDAPLWFGRAIGSGKLAESLMEFVDAAIASDQPNAVMNLSLDLTQVDVNGAVTTRYEFTPQERTAIEYARQNGVLLVVSAGNDGGVMSVLGQASQEFDNILTVGAADGSARADYSSFGTGLDLLAQGGTAENPVISLVDDGVGTMAGSSVATAQVTGAVSRVWAVNPALSYRQVIGILKDTATDLAAPGWDAETGAGLLNLAAAIQVAKATQGEVYDPQAIATLSSGSDGSQGDLASVNSLAFRSQASGAQIGYVNHVYGVGVYFRANASIYSSIIRGLSNGTAVTILGQVSGSSYRAPNGSRRSDWYRVQVNGRTGYIASAYLRTGTSTTVSGSGYVNNASGLRFRLTASTSSSIISRLPNGTPLTILGQVNGSSYYAPGGSRRSDWYRVRVNGQIGYVAAAYVRKGGSGGGYNRNAAVIYARKYAKTRNPAYYAYQQNCANFVAQCLVAGGLFPKYSTHPVNGNYPYTTVLGLENTLRTKGFADLVDVGTLSNSTIKHHIWNTLKAGDVILHDWKNDGSWDHCDIYLGNGQIASNTNDRVDDNIFATRLSSTRVKLLRIKR